MNSYTIDQKLRREDLHGLPCRVPEPTPEQAKCTHTRTVGGYWDVPSEYLTQMFNDEDYTVDSEWIEEYEQSICVDIPGTNNFRCTRCGYTRRY